MRRILHGLLLLPLAACASSPGGSTQGGPTLQYRSPTGETYYSMVDTGVLAEPRRALAADPRNVDRIIALGVAQSGFRKFREAIETFSQGLQIEPNNPMLYRWRGHRYLSVREFDRAKSDLLRGFALDSTNYGVLYHLGIVRFAEGDFEGAVDAFTRAQPRAPDANELAGATDWLWMSLMRAGRAAEARDMLARRPETRLVAAPAPSGSRPEMNRASPPQPVNAYVRRLQLYRGEIQPGAVITSADTADTQVATLAYGIGNWYLVYGDAASARNWFEHAIRSGGWAAFGFILSEVELRRMAGGPRQGGFMR